MTMLETESDATEPAETHDEPDDSAEEQTFTANDVERIVKERLKRDRRARAAKQRQPKQAKDTAQDKDAETDAPDDGSWRDDFYDSIDGLRLSRAQRRRLRDAFKRERPSDPDAWVDEWCRDFGIEREGDETEVAKKPESSNETTDESEETQTQPKPASDRGPPSGGRDWDDILDPNQLSADDIQRMHQKYGKQKANRKIREMAEAWAKGRALTR